MMKHLKVGKLYKVIFATTQISSDSLLAKNDVYIGQDDVLIYLGEEIIPKCAPRIMSAAFLTPSGIKIYFDEYSDVYNHAQHYFKEVDI